MTIRNKGSLALSFAKEYSLHDSDHDQGMGAGMKAVAKPRGTISSGRQRDVVLAGAVIVLFKGRREEYGYP